MLFDSLTHATSDGKWLGTDRYDASLVRLLQCMDQAGVEKACLVAIAEWVDNETVGRFASQYPERFVPIGSINPCQLAGPREIQEAIRRLHDDGYRGLKLHPRLNSYDPMDGCCVDAIQVCGQLAMPVFLDTLFRQRDRVTRHPTDVIDYLVHEAPETDVVLLHGAGPNMLEMFDLVRMHPRLMLDLSFSINRYAGSSLDADIRFVCEQLDQRVCIGSDFPEYTPQQSLDRFQHLVKGLPAAKLRNITHDNLARLFPGDGSAKSSQ